MGSQKRAGLHVIVGPMFSGKSAELIHWLKLYKVQGAPVAAFTHGLSVQQGEGFIKSRNGETFPARAIQQVMHLAPQLDAFRPGWVLAFDEFQFFTPEDAGIVIELAKDHYVLVAGLDTDFRREPFESMQVLMSKGKDLPCYTETWVKAVCHKCGQHNAVYTQRLVNGKPAPYDSPLILPGDQGLYEARCEACYEPPVRDLPRTEVRGGGQP